MIDKYLLNSFEEAELFKNWTSILQILQSSSETEIDPLPDWLAVEIIWMDVQFEQQLLEANQAEKDILENSIATLKKLPYWQQVQDFNRRFALLDRQYLFEQGIETEISLLSQFLAHPKSKEISPHRLLNGIYSGGLFHHPLVAFFRYSSGYFEVIPAPNKYFDCDWYRKNYLQNQFIRNPLLHYQEHFRKPGIQPSQHFHNDFIRKSQKLAPHADPLSFYLKTIKNQGIEFRVNGFSPCPYFDRTFYLKRNQDIRIATESTDLDPFYHFIAKGIKEGRRGHQRLREKMVTQTMINDFQATAKLAVLVLGMHRSGTSALTRVINLLGMDLVTNLMEATPANKTGYWESIELAAIHDDILDSVDSSWDDILPLDDSKFQTELGDHYKTVLIDYIVREFSGSRHFVVKDPRMCRLVPLWLYVLDKLNIQVKIVIPFRHPIEVAKSLQKRDGFLPEKSYLLWLRYVLSAEKHTRGLQRCFVNYSQLLANPQEVINIIAERCGLHDLSIIENESQIKQFVDMQYYHQQVSNDDLQKTNLSEWIMRCYNELESLSDNPIDERQHLGNLDNIAELILQADRLFDNLIDPQSNRHALLWC